MSAEGDQRRVHIAGHDLGLYIEVGDTVTALTGAPRPIMIDGQDWAMYPYEARRLAELLMRPNARQIGEQLLRAVEIMKEQRDDE